MDYKNFSTLFFEQDNGFINISLNGEVIKLKIPKTKIQDEKVYNEFGIFLYKNSKKLKGKRVFINEIAVWGNWLLSTGAETVFAGKQKKSKVMKLKNKYLDCEFVDVKLLFGINDRKIIDIEKKLFDFYNIIPEIAYEKTAPQFAFKNLFNSIGDNGAYFKWLWGNRDYDNKNVTKKAYSPNGLNGFFNIDKNRKVEHENIYCIDVNSLYPSILKNNRLPFGKVYEKDGYYGKNDFCKENARDKYYNFFEFTVKNIRLKKDVLFSPLTYKVNKDGKIRPKELLSLEKFSTTLSEADFSLLEKYYDYDDIVFHKTYMVLTAKVTDMEAFISKWEKRKINGNEVEKQISKLILNSIVGKFGSKWNKLSYFPLACFITSEARVILCEMIENVKALGGEPIYFDTDSVWFKDESQGKVLLKLQQQGFIHKSEFGKWKVEHENIKAVFREKKWYAFEENGKLVTKTAGVHPSAFSNFTLKRFIFDIPKNYREKIESCGFLTYVQNRGGVCIH